jgi:hypothetical protein
MTPEQELLWNKVRSFEPDEPESPLTFTDRLSRENGWLLEFSLRAVEEYKKFMFLICLAPHALTPSDEVDQVWHLHLLYTESYWDDFCCDTLGKKIHHGPTKGGSSEQLKYDDLYARTKNFYKEIFSEDPPEDLWPPPEIRFGRVNFQRVNLDGYWMIPKPRIFRK